MTAGLLLLLGLLGAQTLALVLLCVRLAPGRYRLPPAAPVLGDIEDTTVSVVVPARNEATRIGPCLDGLRRQRAPMTEVIVVDGGSTDGTGAMVDAASRQDPRIRRIDEPPRTPDRVGRPWAIAAGCDAARGEWILVVDADVTPNDGMVGGALLAARASALDAVSFAPRIIAPTGGSRWMQHALLTTIVYRFGATGVSTPPERLVANGQCLLMRRDVLERLGGYGVASRSFCDDVLIMRHLAARGAKVGFHDGRRLLDVVMYRTLAETWRAWPRSLSMRDATATSQHWQDALFLILAQAIPLPLLLLLPFTRTALGMPASLATALIAVNSALFIVRLLVAAATAPSFARRGAAYWMAPFADLPAVSRVIATMTRPAREWRGEIRAEPVPG